MRIFVTSLIVLFLLGCASMESRNSEIEIEPTANGPFKYFQLRIESAVGLEGEVLLNGTKIGSLDKAGFQLSSNEAQTLIKNGENKIQIKLSGLTRDAKPLLNSTDSLLVALHALKDAGAPDESNRVIEINWSPKKLEDRTYVFSISRFK